eukprot:gnl/Trimastix_PCT/4056.p1 GENE.gnl/Trimastix_PCT/4056~~gnl/Trimastix_PCT/4056.p1  ORF type:complete len:306 (+),score=99.76 gnl/Trimastix_PCT/4056:74-991(+)
MWSWVKSFFRWGAPPPEPDHTEQDTPEPPPPPPEENRDAPPPPARRNRLNRLRNAATDDTRAAPAGRAAPAALPEPREPPPPRPRRQAERAHVHAPAPAPAPASPEDLEKRPGKKMGKRKLEKLARKEERAREREAMMQELEERRRLEDERYEAQQRADEARREEEEREREAERARIEEQRRKEEEEYQRVKHLIQEVDSGMEAGGGGDDPELLSRFIAHIQERRFVVLEDLAAEFHLRPQEAINRVIALQTSRQLTGVIDDRGRFIYIAPAQLHSLAEFVRAKGRVSISDLTTHCNSLLAAEAG